MLPSAVIIHKNLRNWGWRKNRQDKATGESRRCMAAMGHGREKVNLIEYNDEGGKEFAGGEERDEGERKREREAPLRRKPRSASRG